MVYPEVNVWWLAGGFPLFQEQVHLHSQFPASNIGFRERRIFFVANCNCLKSNCLLECVASFSFVFSCLYIDIWRFPPEIFQLSIYHSIIPLPASKRVSNSSWRQKALRSTSCAACHRGLTSASRGINVAQLKTKNFENVETFEPYQVIQCQWCQTLKKHFHTRSAPDNLTFALSFWQVFLARSWCHLYNAYYYLVQIWFVDIFTFPRHTSFDRRSFEEVAISEIKF